MNDDLSVRERKRVVQLINILLSECCYSTADSIKDLVEQLNYLLVTNEELTDDLSSREESKVVKYIKELQFKIIHDPNLDHWTNVINELDELLIFH